jgi:hypothetical protein
LLGTATATAAPAAVPDIGVRSATGSVPAPFTASQTSQARAAATTPAIVSLLSRFFTRDLAGGHGQTPAATGAAAPRLVGPTVTVYTLDPGFVAERQGAPVADPDFLASKAVSASGQVASLWTARTASGWKVVNIATGGEETDYVARAHGDGTVFREPQINAWYVLRGDRVLPLDAEARHAVGAGGTTLAAYQRRVHQAYADMLPGSAYDRAGKSGGFAGGTAPVSDTAAAAPVPSVGTTVPAAVAGCVALAAGLGARRRLRGRRTG